MKIALCISGTVRTFKKCYQSLIDNIINLYDCDVFMFIQNGENVKDMDLIKSVKKVIVEPPVLDEKDYKKYVRHMSSVPLQNFLRQIYNVKMCNDLVLDYEKQKNIKYEWIIRCRTDIIITKKLSDLDKLDNDIIYIPRYSWHNQDHLNKYYPIGRFNFAKSDCIPDFFAFSSPKLMKIYASDRYNDFDQLVKETKVIFPERTLGDYLKKREVKVDIIESNFYVPDRKKYANGYPKS
jgi:hypothetical protein